MAEYTTVQRLLDTVPKLESATSISSADIHDFIIRAESIVNAKLSRLYTTPVNGCPLVDTLATDIAGYLLLTRRVFTNEKRNESPWPDRYKESLNLLDQVAQGEITLVNSAHEVIATKGTVTLMESNTMNYSPTFNEGDIGDWEVDSDKLDDIDGLDK